MVLSILGLVGGLVANKGVGRRLAVFCLENAAGLNCTKYTEDVSEVLFISLVAETFNIELASLL